MCAERTKAHARNGDGCSQIDRFLGMTCPQRYGGLAALAIAFKGVTGGGSSEEHQIVKARKFTFRAEAADRVNALIRHALDLGDDRGRKAFRFLQGAGVECVGLRGGFSSCWHFRHGNCRACGPSRSDGSRLLCVRRLPGGEAG